MAATSPLRGGARHRGGHVRHAVVDDTFFDKVGAACVVGREVSIDPGSMAISTTTAPSASREPSPGNEERRPLPATSTVETRERPPGPHRSPPLTSTGSCAPFPRIHGLPVPVFPGSRRGSQRSRRSRRRSARRCGRPPRTQHRHISRRRPLRPREQDTAPTAPSSPPALRPGWRGSPPPRSSAEGSAARRRTSRSVSDGRYAAGQNFFREPRESGKVQESEEGGRFRQERKLGGSGSLTFTTRGRRTTPPTPARRSRRRHRGIPGPRTRWPPRHRSPRRPRCRTREVRGPPTA